jgi:hypothetical protein
MRAMVFGNPALISLLKNIQLDIFVDATFDCIPYPFYQCLIIMVYHNETSTYIPVLYALMMHKNEMLYWRVISVVVDCLEWTVTARTDFELMQMNQMWRQCGKEGSAKHVRCLFNLKQAWRQYLIKKCKLSSDKGPGLPGSWVRVSPGAVSRPPRELGPLPRNSYLQCM